MCPNKLFVSSVQCNILILADIFGCHIQYRSLDLLDRDLSCSVFSANPKGEQQSGDTSEIKKGFYIDNDGGDRTYVCGIHEQFLWSTQSRPRLQGLQGLGFCVIHEKVFESTLE
jgi:hypothetical protein